MAAITLKPIPIAKLNRNGVDLAPRSKISSLFGQKISGYERVSLSTSIGDNNHTRRLKPLRVVDSNQSSSSSSFDVVIIGAGIIGLCIARQFLRWSNLSVAVVDAALPCSGATGAGQGYLWKLPKVPGGEKWELAMRSLELWEILAKHIELEGTDTSEIFGWKKTGSLLVGRTSEESSMLRKKVKQLSDAGVRAEFLTSDDLLSEEPELVVGKEGGAAYVPDDYQLDARRAVEFIQKGNQLFAANGRYAEFYRDPATSLLRSGNAGEVEAVQTSKNILHCKKAVVLAAGCWSGSLMHDLIKHHDIRVDLPMKPRKGHLLVIENFEPFKLNHGLMEAGYVKHHSATLNSAQDTSVSMTATMDTSGDLVLGSSRQLVGFNTEVDESIINRIWERAGEFFPKLKNESLADLRQSREVRVGLRPYLPDGKPVIGPVPGFSNLFVAAGHEGEGLALAPGTSEMIVDMVLGNQLRVDPGPFALQGRFC